MITIQRPINGISLNGNEYLLNDDGSIMEFNNRVEAIKFCELHGIDVWCVFGI